MLVLSDVSISMHTKHLWVRDDRKRLDILKITFMLGGGGEGKETIILIIIVQCDLTSVSGGQKYVPLLEKLYLAREMMSLQ